MIPTVFLLFVWFQAMPADKFKTMHLVGVYDTRAACEKAEDFYIRHLVANADMSCVQWYVDTK